MTTTHDHIVKQFDAELSDVKNKILRMATEVESQIREAIRSLGERDAPSAQRVAGSDAKVNSLEMEIDESCIRLLALRQPAASDLRFIAAALKISTDLERMGDLAVNIAERAEALVRSPKAQPVLDLSRIAAEAQTMLRDSLDAFVSGDAAKAEAVLAQDDIVDRLFVEAFGSLMAAIEADASCAPAAIGLLFIAKHLERIADHATNVAEMVVFLVKGQDVRHRFTLEPLAAKE